MSWVRLASLAVAAIGPLLLIPPAALAQQELPRLRPAAVEIGLNGSVVAVDGAARTSLGALAGILFKAGPGLGEVELQTSYSHVSSLDVFDVAAYLDWQFAVKKTSLYPFLGVGAGIRQEWLGSFEATRYPVGLMLGFKLLASRTVAIRVDYRFRRVLDDPVEDFNEQELRFGLSLSLNNQPPVDG
jgi:hypothetical protein